jgi:hypothetical protein
VEKDQVSLALSKDLIRLIDKRGGSVSRSAEREYLIKLGLQNENQHDNEEVKQLQFKPKLSAVLALLNGVGVGLAYSEPRKHNGNNHMFAITTGATAKKNNSECT